MSGFVTGDAAFLEIFMATTLQGQTKDDSTLNVDIITVTGIKAPAKKKGREIATHYPA